MKNFGCVIFPQHKRTLQIHLSKELHEMLDVFGQDQSRSLSFIRSVSDSYLDFFELFKASGHSVGKYSLLNPFMIVILR